MQKHRKVRFESDEDDSRKNSRAITVERLANEIKNCYDTVDEGRQLLKQLYDKILDRNIEWRNGETQAERNDYQLSREIASLRRVLHKIAEKRDHYIRQLTNARNIVWNDRKQMEEFLRNSRKVERRFREKVKFLTRRTQDPEELISDLKENSEVLSDVLTSLQEQLITEERYIKNKLDTGMRLGKSSFENGAAYSERSYEHASNVNLDNLDRAKEESPALSANDGIPFEHCRSNWHASNHVNSMQPCNIRDHVTEEATRDSWRANPSKRYTENFDSAASHKRGEGYKGYHNVPQTGGQDMRDNLRFSHTFTNDSYLQSNGASTELSDSADRDDCGTTSLSRRLRQLVKQSENVQNLISNVGKKPRENGSYNNETSHMTVDNAEVAIGRDCHSIDNGYGRQNHRNSSVTREMTKDDNIQNAETRPLATQISQCSDRFAQSDKFSHADIQPIQSQVDLIEHEKIRRELLHCLDRIFSMEKSYGHAEEEIKGLKIDLEHALQEKSILERVWKKEAEEMEMRLLHKSKDVECLNAELERAHVEIEELKKDRDECYRMKESKERFEVVNEDLESLRKESKLLKERVDTKSEEVDVLKRELQNAIDEMGKMKNQQSSSSLVSEEVQRYESEIASLRAQNQELEKSKQESIAEELSALQAVIEEAEQKGRKSSLENNRLQNEVMQLQAALRSCEEDISREDVYLATEKKFAMHDARKSNREESLERRVEELEQIIDSKNSEIEALTVNNNQYAANLQLEDFISREEDFQIELKVKDDECKQLRMKLKNYEDLLANEGDEISHRLDEMYENFVKSIEAANKEKDDLEQGLKNQKEIYEELWDDYNRTINELEERGKNLESVLEIESPGKVQILKVLLQSDKTEEELIEFLRSDYVDAIPTQEMKLLSREIEKEKEKLQNKVIELEENGFNRQREIDDLRKKNNHLKEEIDFVKSEHYIKNKVSQDTSKRKIEEFEKLLIAKEEDCNMLRESLRDITVNTEEKNQLKSKLDQIYERVLQTNEEAVRENALLKEQRTLEEILQKDEEVERLREKNGRLRNLLLSIGSENEEIVSDLLDDSGELYKIEKKDHKYDREKYHDLEDENRKLAKRIKELNMKLLENGEVADENKTLKRKLREVERHSQSIDEENLDLRKRLRILQNEVKELSSIRTEEDMNDALLLKKNNQLRELIVLKELENEHSNDDIDRLKSRLHESENEVDVLRMKLESFTEIEEKSRKLQESNVDRQEKLGELTEKLSIVEKERKEINEEYVKQKIKNEEDAKLFSNEINKLKNEVNNLLNDKKHGHEDALDVSHESLPDEIHSDEKDGNISRYDRNRMIKKLQIEKQQLAARIMSLEDETTAISKIVADMERGHGHLTGILRGHLILQKETTAKLLENSLKQYSDEFEAAKRKFKAVEDRYDKDKKYSTRRNFARDLFANATATLKNINAILEEGLIKVEGDLERDFSSDEDFEAKDYKSRLWILRSRLSDVENRYRELMLRAEELSIRLDAKMAEYDVIQDELEDTIKAYEISEATLSKVRQELNHCLTENSRLKSILGKMEKNKEEAVGAVIAENDMLKKQIGGFGEEISILESMAHEMSGLQEKAKESDIEVKELTDRLHDMEKRNREEVSKMEDKLDMESKKSNDELEELRKEIASAKKALEDSRSRIAELEDMLKKAESDNALLERYLQKARSEARSGGIDHHGTIHMLRDDLKKLFKENSDLKKEISDKQKTITSLAADLRKAKIHVKEQLGTARTIDEQILDRAAKDQMMALRRRIKVLEMEKDKLQRGISIKESFQKQGDDELMVKRGGKSGSKKKEKYALTKTEALNQSIQSDASDVPDAANPASIQSDDHYVQMNEEIELRDKLIQELELRVRELKHELSLKDHQHERFVSKEVEAPSIDAKEAGSESHDINERSIMTADLESLRKENVRLQRQLSRQKNAVFGLQATEKDNEINHQKLQELEAEIEDKDNQITALVKENDVLKQTAGKDWKKKEIVLIETGANDVEREDLEQDIDGLRKEVAFLRSNSLEQEKIIESLKARNGIPATIGEERLFDRELTSEEIASSPRDTVVYSSKDKKRLQDEEPEIESIAVGTLETAIDFSQLEGADDDHTSIGAQGKSEEISKAQSKETERTPGRALLRQNPSRIPISPRLKKFSSHAQTDKSGSKDAEITRNEDLVNKIKDQEDDIKTLLESVEYFEKENKNLKQKVEETSNMKNRLKKTESEVKNLKSRNSDLKDQLKDSKIHDEKLKSLEEKMKKLITENKTLEQQMKRNKKLKMEDNQETKTQREEYQRKIAEMDNLEKKLEAKELTLQIFKEELGMEELPEDNLKVFLKEYLERKIVESGKFSRTTATSATKVPDIIVTEDTVNLRQTQEDLEDELVKKMSEIGWKNEEIRELKAELYNALTDQSRVEIVLAETRMSLEGLNTEVNDLKARNTVLEVMLDVVNVHEQKPRDGMEREKLGAFESEMSTLRGSNVALEVMDGVINDLRNELQDGEMKNIPQIEAEKLLARNIALEIVLDVVKDLYAKALNVTTSEDSYLSSYVTAHLNELKKVWIKLKKNLHKLKLIDDKSVADDMQETCETGCGISTSDFEAIIADIDSVSSELGKKSNTILSTESDLQEQLDLNIALERRLEEFKQIVDDTTNKIKEMEDAKEGNDEIGHKLMLDQVSNLKEKVKELEEDKNHLKEEAERRLKNVSRLSEQILLLEKQVSLRQSEVAELTQRALESEEELEVVRNRNEELEDDYQKLLQYGLNLDREEKAEEDKQEDQELLLKMEERIQSLELEKTELEKKVEDATFASLLQLDTRHAQAGDGKSSLQEEISEMQESLQILEVENADLQKKISDLIFERAAQQGEEQATKLSNMEDLRIMQEKIDKLQIEKSELEDKVAELEFEGADRGSYIKEEQFKDMEETIYRLELDKHDLQRRVDELDLDAATQNEFKTESAMVEVDNKDLMESKSQELLSMEDTLYRLKLDKEDLERRVEELNEELQKQAAHSQEQTGDQLVGTRETISRLEVDKAKLEQKVASLMSEEKLELEDLRRNLLFNEEKVADLEHELKVVSLDKETIQGALDELLCSPRSGSDDEEHTSDSEKEIFKGGTKEWKRRLVASYRELRNKSIEIASLRRIIEAKNAEISTREAESAEEREEPVSALERMQAREKIYILQKEVEMKAKEIIDLQEENAQLEKRIGELGNEDANKTLNEKDETEAVNDEMKKEIEMLKKELKEKENNYEILCDQLFGAGLEESTDENNQLKHEISNLKQKLDEQLKMSNELEENNKLLYNELVKAKADASLGEKEAVEKQSTDSDIEEIESINRSQEERLLAMSCDYNDLEAKYKDEMNYASARISELMLQVEGLERQQQSMVMQIQGAQDEDASKSSQVLQGRLQRIEEELQRKNGLIANLKETVTSFYDQTDGLSDSLAKELKRISKENTDLQDQLELQKQRYELEIESMAISLSSAKGEHVKSLKDDFERVCNDKVQLQIELSELEEKVAKSNRNVEELVKVNNELLSKVKSLEEASTDNKEDLFQTSDFSF